MMIKFHKTGASGKAAANYLEDDKDHKGRLREDVTVLRGDPFRVGQVADSLDFKHRLTAGVIAWAPEDSPTPAQVDDVLDHFERLAFAGLDADRYAWSAVRHDEPSGGTHVHILAARVDLQTGKSLNIAPPGWQRDFDPLRDVFNLRHGWARPDDPARASNVQLASHERKRKVEAAKSGEPPKVLDIESLTDYLIDHIHMDHINNRADITEALDSLDGVTVTRAGQHYISVKLPGANKATRLRGAIYDEHFNGDLYRQTEAAAGGTGRRTPDAHGAELESAQDRYNQAVRRRGDFNRRKYGEHQALADTEPDSQVVDLPDDRYALPGIHPGAGHVGGRESHRQTPGPQNHRTTHGKYAGTRRA